MIRSLCGEVISINGSTVVLDLNGFGFELLCSRGALSRCELGSRVRLTTYLQLSEAGAFLFGFADDTERELFLKITMIKGIGGRTAMQILGTLSVEEIVQGISLADINTFTRIPGIGRKTAERLCFELKNALPKDLLSVVSLNKSGLRSTPRGVALTVGDALRSLGFSQQDVDAALDVVKAAWGDDFDTMTEETLLKAALKELQHK